MSNSLQIQWPIDDLPRICVHCPDIDNYNQFYEPDDICKCGNCEWTTSALIINVFENQIAMAPKRFQKCSQCKEVRISRMKKQFEKVIKESKALLESFLKISEGEYECLHILKNMIANLERKIVDNHFEKNKEKILSMKKFCNDMKMDQNEILNMMKNDGPGIVQKHV